MYVTCTRIFLSTVRALADPAEGRSSPEPDRFSVLAEEPPDSTVQENELPVSPRYRSCRVCAFLDVLYVARASASGRYLPTPVVHVIYLVKTVLVPCFLVFASFVAVS